MRRSDKDWGKIIFKIAILLFIIFFISRWFAGDNDNTRPEVQPVAVITDDAIDADEPADEAADNVDIIEESALETSPDTYTDEPAVTQHEPVSYEFRNKALLDKHYDKHGIEMGFASAEDYEAAASAVVTNPDALHKLEEEDGDDVFYLEDTGEFVIVSTDGFIRTYYYASKAYFDRQ